jgi:signal transduction histidine kinase
MYKKHIKVLLIEDNQGDIRLIWEILSEVRDSPFYLSVADSLLNGLREIEKEVPDVILLDLSLGDSNGIYTLNRVRDKAPRVPIVILTGMDDEVTAMKALKEGAQDYLLKGRTDADLLKRAIIYAIERFRMIMELEEKQARLMELDKIKYNYILMVFHELLIPAAAIKSAASFAAGQPGGGAFVEVVKNNTQKIFSLLDDLIDVSEIESGSFTVVKKECSIAELIGRNVADLSALAVEKSIVIKSDIGPGLVPVNADFHRISQALANLVISAIKFSPENSAITVSAGNAGDRIQGAPDYAAKLAASAQCMLISISASAAGINPDRPQAAFDSLFSPDVKSTGDYTGISLGLVIAKNIIKAHGGVIFVRADGENRGYSFHILLPIK